VKALEMNDRGPLLERICRICVAVPLAFLLSSAATGGELPKLDGRGVCMTRSVEAIEACLATEAKDKAFLLGASMDELLVKICSFDAEMKRAGYSAMRRCVEDEWRADRKRAITEAEFSPKKACVRQQLKKSRLADCMAGESAAAAIIENSAEAPHRHQDFSRCFAVAKAAGGSSVLYLECMDARSKTASQ
jgi:hypothetical protein